MGSTTNQSTET